MNRVILIGRLTRDPELNYTPNGVARTTFTLAVDRPYTNQQGEREADFIPVVVWRNAAEATAQYTKKGNLVAVEGRLEIRRYQTDYGENRSYTTVVANRVQFLSPKSQNGNNGNNPQENEPWDETRDDFEGIDISDDDLPF